MTDEEIIFDFFTLEATREQAIEQQVSEDPEPSEMSVVPQTGMSSSGNRTSTMSVSADKAEFIRWYEAEVGPWQTK